MTAALYETWMWIFDHWIECLLGVILIGILVFVAWGLLQPSCAERGGTEVFSHFMPIVHKIGETTFVQQVSIYDCVGLR